MIMVLATIYAPESGIVSLTPLFPPFIAIFLAFISGEVLFSLFMGIWLGSVFIIGFNDFSQFFIALFTGFARVIDKFILQSLCDTDKLSIILFTVAIGGLVGIVARSGGTKGVVSLILKFVKDPKSGQIATWFMGLSVFFDDYASCLIVGNTVRPMTDKLKISREKISYIIDSTAAPIACIAFISTWIGFQLGLLQDAFIKYNINMDPYFVFLQSIPYSFYSIFTIFFVFMIAYFGRDFGPMYIAEKRARTEGKLMCDTATPMSSPELDEMEPPEGVTPKAINAILPIGLMLLGIVFGLYFTGKHALLNHPADNVFAGQNVILKENKIVNNDIFVSYIKDSNLKLSMEDKIRTADLFFEAGLENVLHQEVLFSAFHANYGSKKLITLLKEKKLKKKIKIFADTINNNLDKLNSEKKEDAENIAVLSSINRRIPGQIYHQSRFDFFLGIRDILGSSASFKVLLWASFGAGAIGIILVLLQGILTVQQSFEAWFKGGSSMVMAVMVLALAWSLGKVCEDLKTAEYVSSLTQGVISAYMIPLLTFITASVIAFATGTSWATMTILIPIVVKVSIDSTVGTPGIADHILICSIASVLSGSIFGDHCSPISDTTIMSSMASGCDHIHHVKTQIPYALTTGAVAAFCGYLPAAYGIHWTILIPLGIVVMLMIIFTFGSKVDEPEPQKNGYYEKNG